ncbi:hypothetical protein CMUS01_15195 [Colletotrichum musicola]|uniref:Uncharacterized protein n=1 Tax=Colletotrichum musicola TaxID=2175873 RepID=A0A8H6IYW3_9PEZI|nr:hypothetical protein CMUS01_15195 [Colletotrichum musicola]
MKAQTVSAVFFFAAKALAACGPGQVELWDLQVNNGMAECSKHNCIRACPGRGSLASCNACRSSVSNANVRPLGGSYCCDASNGDQSNPCFSRCPN